MNGLFDRFAAGFRGGPRPHCVIRCPHGSYSGAVGFPENNRVEFRRDRLEIVVVGTLPPQ